MLLEGGSYFNTGEAFVADHVFAEFGELFDVDVKMEPAVGVYRAFDIISQSDITDQAASRTPPQTSPSSPEDEEDTDSLPRTERTAKQAAAGILLAAAATAYATGNRRREPVRKANGGLKS